MPDPHRDDALDELGPLLEPNPAATEKLIAAWGGLLSETQVRILSRVGRLPQHLRERVCDNALDSASPYVRYLAARSRLNSSNRPSKDWDQVAMKIKADASSLVQFAILGKGISPEDTIYTPEAFFALPQSARLSLVHDLDFGGSAVASLMTHGVKHELTKGLVTEAELLDVLWAFVASSNFKSAYEKDCHFLVWDAKRVRAQARGEIEDLWRLVPSMPDLMARVLIENLPTEANDEPGSASRREIPDDILSGLNEEQLSRLLQRSDVELPDFRMQAFLENGRRSIRGAAVSSNFKPDAAYFGKLLRLSESDRVDRLVELSQSAQCVSLPILAAIGDSLRSIGESNATKERAATRAEHQIRQSLLELSRSDRQHQIRELRIYHLAKQAAPWKIGDVPLAPSGMLEHLNASVVPGDPWETYSRMSAASQGLGFLGSFGLGDFIADNLPKLDAIDLSLEPDRDEHVGLTRHAQSEFRLAYCSRNLVANPENRSLAGLLMDLTRNLEEHGRALDLSSDIVRKELKALRAMAERLRFLVYFVVALLVALVIYVFRSKGAG